jgi:hypothetical protein
VNGHDRFWCPRSSANQAQRLRVQARRSRKIGDRVGPHSGRGWCCMRASLWECLIDVEARGGGSKINPRVAAWVRTGLEANVKMGKEARAALIG